MDYFLLLTLLLAFAIIGIYRALRDVQFIYRSPSRYVIMDGRLTRLIVAAGVVLMADFFIHTVAGALA